MTHDYPRHPLFDSVTAERVRALAGFGLTERQRQFLVTVMIHAGCFLERQYCAFTGTVRGQNSREFVARLVARGFVRAIEPGPVRRGRLYHVHHKPLYEAIFQPDDRNRRLHTVGRMVERVMILDAVLGGQDCWWLSPERGRAICANGADVPMTDADELVIEVLLDDVLTPDVIEEAIDGALALIQGDAPADRLQRLETDLGAIRQERDRLVSAIATGGELPGLLEALTERDARRQRLEAEREAIRSRRRFQAADSGRIREELVALAGSWRRVLSCDAPNARPIVSTLLQGRVRFTPGAEAKRWRLTGAGTLIGLFEGEIFPSEWRPQRDSNPRFGLERATS